MDASPSLIRHTTGTHDIHAMILYASREHPARRGTMTMIHPHTRAYVHGCGSKHVVSLARDAVHAHTPPPPRSLTARPARPAHSRAHLARARTRRLRHAPSVKPPSALSPRTSDTSGEHGSTARMHKRHATRGDGLHTHTTIHQSSSRHRSSTEMVHLTQQAHAPTRPHRVGGTMRLDCTTQHASGRDLTKSPP